MSSSLALPLTYSLVMSDKLHNLSEPVSFNSFLHWIFMKIK